MQISAFTHTLMDRFKTTLLAPQTEWMVSVEAPLGFQWMASEGAPVGFVSSHFVEEHDNGENGL